MRINKEQDDEFKIELSREELGSIGNALNEVCNGVHIHDAEFQTRLGVTRNELRTLLDQIVAAYRSGLV